MLLNRDKKLKSFVTKLEDAKKQKVPFKFYPYSSVTNVHHLQPLLTKAGTTLEKQVTGKTVLDIGAADGDMSFYSEYLKAKSVTVIEHAPTNFNGVKGLKHLRKVLKSHLKLLEFDIDNDPWKGVPKVEFTFLLGILYHLKNPILVLERLSYLSKRIVVSSRIFDVLSSGMLHKNYSRVPIAYLWAPAELNNDATNWWCWTEKSMELAMERCGWKILSTRRVDSKVGQADPYSSEKDGRYFIYAESTR